MKPKPPRGVYDRGTSWQAKVRRADGQGRHHAITRSFPYDGAAPASSPHSRASALARASAFAAGERAALRFERRPASDLPQGQTLDDLLTRYADDVLGGMENNPAAPPPNRRCFRSERSMVRQLRAVVPALVARPVLKLHPDEFRVKGKTQPPHSLAAALAATDPPTQPQTVVRYLVFLSGVFTHAATAWGMHDLPNPVRGLTGDVQWDGRERLIAPKEWRAILAALREASPGTVAAIRFLRATACRRGEAAALTWDAIDWRSKPPLALLRETKAGKPRKVPLLPDAVRALAPLRRGKGKAATWPTSGSVFGVRADSLTQSWLRACFRAEVKDARLHLGDARLHDLRHTRLTEITQRLPLQDAMKLSGHTRADTLLRRYYNRTPADVGLELAKLERRAKRRR